MSNITERVKAIADQNPDGFTVDRDTLAPVRRRRGYAVAARPLSGDEKPDCHCFGGWKDPATGIYYLDEVMIVDDLSKALELGASTNQISIWDFASQKAIEVSYATV